MRGLIIHFRQKYPPSSGPLCYMDSAISMMEVIIECELLKYRAIPQIFYFP
jgi:hypothetical protein